MATVEIDLAEIADIIGVAGQCDYAKGKALVETIVEAVLYDLKNEYPDPEEADGDEVSDTIWEAADGSVVYTMDSYNIVFYAGDDVDDLEDLGADSFDGVVSTMAFQIVQQAIAEKARQAGYDV